MSEGLDRHKYNHGDDDAMLAGNSEVIPPGRTKAALLQATWAAARHRCRNLIRGLNSGSVATCLRRQPALRVFLWMLVIPAAAVILGYLIAPTQRIAKQAAVSAERVAVRMKPKPSPGKPLRSVMQAPTPSLAHAPSPYTPRPRSLPATAPAPQSPVMASVSAPRPAPPSPAPLAPAVAAKSPYTPLVYRARHDKHFGEACSGQLTLDSSALVFKCPDDPRHSVQVALNDIESVDSNGVRLTSGKKYHFSIPGMTKDSEEELFAQWLDRVR